jgi:hypothetical protein
MLAIEVHNFCILNDNLNKCKAQVRFHLQTNNTISADVSQQQFLHQCLSVEMFVFND